MQRVDIRWILLLSDDKSKQSYSMKGKSYAMVPESFYCTAPVTGRVNLHIVFDNEFCLYVALMTTSTVETSTN